MLQEHNWVAALQHRPLYNLTMNPTANHENHEPAPSTPRPSGRWRGAGFWRSGLIAAALLGTGVLVAACGGGSSGAGVASLLTTTTTTASSAPQTGTAASTALAYVSCMRANGEPNMPDPPAGGGNHVHISITAGSGVDPSSPEFTRATNACKHLLPDNGVPSDSITPADQADYLTAAACMRSHGVPDFPDPTFQDDSVTFSIRRPLDPNSSQYKSALATCQKLIPAGLPYSSASGS
jgi:hypothetical protein